VSINCNHRQAVFENCLEWDFAIEAPDHVYADDITCPCVDAARMAVPGRGHWPVLGQGRGLVDGTAPDRHLGLRGSADGAMASPAAERAIGPPFRSRVHYASEDFRKLLKAHGIEGSVSRKGDCWDNVVVESFFATMKSERIH